MQLENIDLMISLYYCNHNSSLVVVMVSRVTELNILISNIILLLAVVVSNSDPKHEINAVDS